MESLNASLSRNFVGVKTKVLGVVFSPRKGGNTEILVREALRGAREFGAETELVAVRDFKINPCSGCLSCNATGRCQIDDDMQLMYEKLLEANGIIFGTPVYSYHICGQAKIFIDRTFALTYPTLRLSNKVGAAIAVATRLGISEALGFLIGYFVRNHMLCADPVDGLATEKGSIVRDERAMRMSFELGKQVTAMTNHGKIFPDEYNIPLYRLARKKYGVPTYPKNL